MAGDIVQRAADYWPRMTRITCICSPCRAGEKRAKPARRRPRSPRSFLRPIAGANKGATRRPRVRRRSAAPRCARYRARASTTRGKASWPSGLSCAASWTIPAPSFAACASCTRARNEREEIARLRALWPACTSFSVIVLDRSGRLHIDPTVPPRSGSIFPIWSTGIRST